MTRPILPAMRRLFVLLVAATLFASCGGQTAAGPDRPVRILSGSPTTLDPAAQGDAGSAAITAQLFESLTSFDADLQVRPALAESWRFSDDGRQVTFHLRPDLTFSDGSPLRPSDVVRSWLRLIDPDRPSPLASLALDIAGAEAYLRGTATDPASVGLHADDGAGDLVVDLVRPATDFVNIVAGPTFSVVPPGVGEGAAALTPGPDFVASGGYVLSGENDDGPHADREPALLGGAAGDHHHRTASATWAGAVRSTPSRRATSTTPRSSGSTPRGWPTTRRSDRSSGWSTRCRSSTTASIRPRRRSTIRCVRRAFGQAIDWRRMAALSGGDGTAQVANSMVPPGIPGRSDEDFLPAYDPAAARDLLAQAGYPGGAGFPATVLMTGGSGFDAAIVAEVKRELGITLQAETMGDGYFDRLASDAPQMWALAWVADYPGRNDFLGVLLNTGASNNYGHWSSPAFDAAILEATSASDPAEASAAYDRAERVVRDEVPVVPLVYGPGWALSRTGLLGAGQNGLGIVRMAGLEWAD